MKSKSLFFITAICLTLAGCKENYEQRIIETLMQDGESEEYSKCTAKLFIEANLSNHIYEAIIAGDQSSLSNADDKKIMEIGFASLSKCNR